MDQEIHLLKKSNFKNEIEDDRNYQSTLHIDRAWLFPAVSFVRACMCVCMCVCWVMMRKDLFLLLGCCQTCLKFTALHAKSKVFFYFVKFKSGWLRCFGSSLFRLCVAVPKLSVAWMNECLKPARPVSYWKSCWSFKKIHIKILSTKLYYLCT